MLDFEQHFYQDAPLSSATDFAVALKRLAPAEIRTYFPNSNALEFYCFASDTWLVWNETAHEFHVAYSGPYGGGQVVLHFQPTHAETWEAVCGALGLWAGLQTWLGSWTENLVVAQDALNFGLEAYATPNPSQEITYEPGTYGGFTVEVLIYDSLGSPPRPQIQLTYSSGFPTRDVNDPAGTRTLEGEAAVDPVLYRAVFQDSGGELLAVAFRCRRDADARALANELAANSDARWVELVKVSPVSIPLFASDGSPADTNYRQPAAAGSNVELRGRAVWASSVPGDRITVELPSPKASVVSKGSQESREDLLEAGTRALLTTENGAPAMVFRQVRFVPRPRR